VLFRSRRPASGTPQKNLELFAADIAELADKKADIICLPEGITVVGTGKVYADVVEPIPGPSTEFLGKVAAKHKVYVAAGLYERDGKVLYNTCVLIGRDGKLIGKYRKACLPDEEVVGGLCPGSDFPVFETDFGRVGMMICWDLSYPEVSRALAAKGAEVILMPIWGGDETLARARAIENQVFLVASGYDFRSALYAPTGKPLASAAKDPREASENLVVEVDLNAETNWPWVGNWKARVAREMPASGPSRE
jgi:predicted amidohydrolase